MEYNFPQNLLYCGQIVDGLTDLLNYSHVPSSIAVIAIGLYVLIKSKYSLQGKALFSIALCFSLWTLSNLLIWRLYDNNSLIMAIWSTIEIYSVMLYVLCLYFAYVFIEKKDVSILVKLIAIAPVVVCIFVSPTRLNLIEYDIQECIAIENPVYANYFLTLKIAFSLWMIIYTSYKFFRVEKSQKKQVLLLVSGMAIFLLSFMVSGYLAEQTELFIYEVAGLFGMVIFVGFLGYLIVNFKAFNIQLIAANALVITMIFLTGAGIFYVNGTVDLLLTLSRFLFICLAGFYLTKSVKKEINQRNKIEKLALELETANAELKDLDRQKDELISIVSHQLATPVTSVKWYLEMLLDGDSGALNEEQTKQLKTMQGVTADLVDLVGMILDVSRIQLGRMKVDRTALNLGEFFADILAVIEPKVQVKNQQFIKSIPSALPIAMLDKRLMRMTLENLLTNAVKYTPEGGKVELTVAVQGKMLRYQVKDTGCGIPKEEQGKIFGKLYRASNVRNVEGNGFGLFAAKGAVEAQGGKVWFTSTPKGTTFFVEVPLEEVTKEEKKV